MLSKFLLRIYNIALMLRKNTWIDNISCIHLYGLTAMSLHMSFKNLRIYYINYLLYAVKISVNILVIPRYLLPRYVYRRKVSLILPNSSVHIVPLRNNVVLAHNLHTRHSIARYANLEQLSRIQHLRIYSLEDTRI